MHLRPARYTPNPINQFEEPPVEGHGALAGSALQRKKSPLSAASSSSSPSSLIEASGRRGGGGGSDGVSGTNNNNQGIQFMANKQTHSPANIFNGKLNGDHNNNNNNNILLAAQSARYNSTDLQTADGRSKPGIKLFFPKSAKSYSSSNNTSTRNNNNNGAMHFSKHDKIKLMELSVINLVQLSTMAAEHGDQELALTRAREALEGFNSLRAVSSSQERAADKIGSNIKNKADNNLNDSLQDTSPPPPPDGSKKVSASATPAMTTGVSLYELSLMIHSNLAAQLANNGHHGESIELYAQLCKIASGYGLNSNQATMVGLSSSNRSQNETKFLLYRFGLNIGNIYYEMKEYQRALKYYRLTLDRLSVSSAYRNIRIKIMNNIALTLLAMGQLSEAATSLNLLLSDNLVPSSGANEPTTNLLMEVSNSNHHQLGLNLMVCHHQRADLNSMTAALKALVKVGICQQYKQVVDLTDAIGSSLDMLLKDDEFIIDGQRSSRGSYSATAMTTNVAATAQASMINIIGDGSAYSKGNSRQSKEFMGWLKEDVVGGETIRAAAGEASSFLGATREKQIPMDAHTNKTVSAKGLADMDGTTTLERNAHMMLLNENIRTGGETVMSSMSVMGDELDHKQWRPLINSQLETIGLHLITRLSTAERTRQLMMLIRDDRLDKLIRAKHNQISRSLIMGCNLMLNLDKSLIQSNTNGQSGDGKGSYKTSVLEYCVKLMTASESYPALVFELQANQACKMLMKRYNLDKAITILKKMGQEQQADGNLHRDNTGSSTVKNSIPFKYNNISNLKKNSNFQLNQSTMVATNLSLFNLLRGNIDDATRYGHLAMRTDYQNVQALINLANCYQSESDVENARALYQRALQINPDDGIANYDLILLDRKSKRNLNELDDCSRRTLSKYQQCHTSLIWRKMILPVIQSVLIYHQSGLLQQTQPIINDLLTSAKQAPEVILLASRLVNETSEKDANVKTPVDSILQQAHKDNPHHLPMLERLIALNIQIFNYEQAKCLLCICILNRPDQVKWYKILAECYIRAADYNKAIATYKAAVEAFPLDTDCLIALNKLTAELGLNE